MARMEEHLGMAGAKWGSGAQLRRGIASEDSAGRVTLTKFTVFR